MPAEDSCHYANLILVSVNSGSSIRFSSHADPMQTPILEKKNKESAIEREIRLLLETAGKDRPSLQELLAASGYTTRSPRLRHRAEVTSPSQPPRVTRRSRRLTQLSQSGKVISPNKSQSKEAKSDFTGGDRESKIEPAGESKNGGEETNPVKPAEIQSAISSPLASSEPPLLIFKPKRTSRKQSSGNVFSKRSKREFFRAIQYSSLWKRGKLLEIRRTKALGTLLKALQKVTVKAKIGYSCPAFHVSEADNSRVVAVDHITQESPFSEQLVESLEMAETIQRDLAMKGVEENLDSQIIQSQLYPLTEKCHHYTHISQVDWDIQKYWHQRHSIFSMYDDGIHMTDDAWFGVTPEPVANKVANDLAASSSPSKTVVIDIFAGAGGNAIAFALSDRWAQVIAIEKDPSVIACGQHNASIYGVSDQITWVKDDCFSYLTANSSKIKPEKTVIFASPPWGGPGYRSDDIFNLNTMAPYSAKQIHNLCRRMDCALYLPRTSDLRQIAKLAPDGKKVEVVQYCMEGASKALVAYIPAATS